MDQHLDNNASSNWLVVYQYCSAHLVPGRLNFHSAPESSPQSIKFAITMTSSWISSWKAQSWSCDFFHFLSSAASARSP